MKMNFFKYFKTLFAVIVLIFPSFLMAQSSENKSGTIYSRYGTGFPVLLNTAQEKGMGITGISFNDLRTAGVSNPAFWGSGSYSRIAANFDFTNYSVQDNGGSGENTIFNFGSFQGVFPIIKDKLGASIALYPETRSSYNISTNESIVFGDTNFEFGSQKVGTGGVSKFEIGLGYKLFDYLSVGYASSYSFLTEEEQRTVTFLDGLNLRDNTSQLNVEGNSFSHRFGLLYSKSKVFREQDIVQIGGTFNLATEFDAKRNSETLKQINASNELVQVGTTEKATVSTPTKWGVGLTYFSGPKFNASLEYYLEKWSDAEYGFSQNEETAFSDRAYYGLGVQFHPYNSRSNKFLSNFKYSLGMSYDTGHLKIQDEEINTLWFSAGLGLISPNLRSASSFDLSFQYGLRGTTNQNLVKENIFSINFTINLTELMFLQRKLN